MCSLTNISNSIPTPTSTLPPTMRDPKPKEQTQYDRIQQFCKLLWGESDYGYDMPIETDDYINYHIYIRKHLGTSLGGVLTGAIARGSAERATNELERKLAIMCKHAISGVPMTREERVDCSCGKKGEWRDLLKAVYEFEEQVHRNGMEAKRV
jgi:hypothetical protein